MSLKLKLTSVVALFTLMLGILIMGVFAATQSINLTGSLNFNIPDRSLYVKDIRIKQDLNEEPVSLEGFMPGYLNSNYTLDLTNVTETNTYSSFTLYFDVINTTESMWEIKNVTLPTILEEQGVFVSGYSGRVEVNSTLTDSDGDSYKEITDVANTTYNTFTISISNPNASAENPLSLDGIVITIDEYVPPTVTTTAIGEDATETNLGLATSEGYAIVGEEITLNVEFAGEDADFLGWKESEDATEYISTLPNYTFTFEETSPTEYYAVFTEPNSYLTYNYNTQVTGEAQLASCSSGATNITVPSAIYRTGSAYTVTSMYDSNSYRNGVFYQTRSTLQSVSLPETLTNIGDYAFYYSNLTSITIPEGVESIGNYSFNYSNDLVSITLPNTLTNIDSYAFAACDGLTNITIPEQVESIGDCVFNYSSNLTSVILPSTLTSISSSAFNYCSGLESITVEAGNSVYHSAGNCIIETDSKTLIAGCNNSTIPTDGSVTSISSYAFRGCSGLASITLPSTLTSIGSYAFSDCSGLTNISLPSTLISIGSYAFSGCNKLTGNLVIPSSVTSIGQYAFQFFSEFTDIGGFTNIVVEAGNNVYHSSGNCLIETDSKTLILGCNNSTIPTDGSVTSIEDYAFDGCSGLKNISLPSTLTSIGDYAFRNCSSITGDLVVPSGVTYIGDYAFYNCSSLESLTLPDSLTWITNSTFSNCSGLTSVSLPNTLTMIASSAFYNCSNLTSITLPSTFVYIEDNVFSGCYGLAEVYNYSSSITIGFDSSNGAVGSYAYVIYNASDLAGGKPASKIQTIGNVQYYVDGADFIALAPAVVRDSLTTLTLDSRTTSINRYAFYGCSNLTSLTIPEGVTSIGNYAFEYCSSLTSITINATEPPTLGSNALRNTNISAIYVPAGTVETYQTYSGWSSYADIISAIA